MNFDSFLNQSWTEHATNTDQVAEALPRGFALIEHNEQISPFAQLIAHVFGEHLKRWDQGVELLISLKNLDCFTPQTEAEAAINRSIAILQLASGQNQTLADFSISDCIRILSTAASTMNEQGNVTQAGEFFRSALEMAKTELPREDLSHRSLAVTGNNIACDLEAKNSLSPEETELMILAAQTARKYWEIAGTWLQLLLAEYRLSQTFLKANRPKTALEHAKACLELCKTCSAEAREFFFANEGLALAEHALGNITGYYAALLEAQHYYKEMGAENRTRYETAIKYLESLFGV